MQFSPHTHALLHLLHEYQYVRAHELGQNTHAILMRYPCDTHAPIWGNIDAGKILKTPQPKQRRGAVKMIVAVSYRKCAWVSHEYRMGI